MKMPPVIFSIVIAADSEYRSPAAELAARGT
jgi:hypothetical protein